MKKQTLQFYAFVVLIGSFVSLAVEAATPSRQTPSRDESDFAPVRQTRTPTIRRSTAPRSEGSSRGSSGAAAVSSSEMSRTVTCQASAYTPPIDNPRITSCFGRPRRGRGGRVYAHQGTDLNGPRSGPGAKVKAVAGGKVRAMGNMGGRTGNTIIMDHPNCPSSAQGPVGATCVSVYRHLSSRYLVRSGNCYAGGAGIGYVGRKGPENGRVDPHVHIEIISNGRAYNVSAFPAIVPGNRCSRALTSVSGATPQSLWQRRSGTR